jgi:hypothetical protein
MGSTQATVRAQAASEPKAARSGQNLGCRPVAHLFSALLASGQSFHKLCQPGREGVLDRSVGLLQELPEPLKLRRIRQLV